MNARDAPLYARDRRGFYCEFEGFGEHEPDFSQLGMNITVLGPDEPMGGLEPPGWLARVAGELRGLPAERFEAVHGVGPVVAASVGASLRIASFMARLMARTTSRP